jgi:hypothetical protein
MNSCGQFCDSSCADQMQIAGRELSAFVRAVTQRYGSEEAKLAAEDWLDEFERMDSPALSTSGSWRAVTIAVSARLANRLTAPRHVTADRRMGARIHHVLTGGSMARLAG